MEQNPYAAPRTDLLDPAEETPEEVVRRAHLTHETSIKAMATLYGIAAVVATAVTIALFISPAMVGRLQVAACGAGAVTLGMTSCGLHCLRPWSRWMATALSCLGLPAFPLTLLAVYFLYLLLLPKASVVFSAEYQQVIAATPHIRYRSFALLVLLLILGSLIALVVIGLSGAPPRAVGIASY